MKEEWRKYDPTGKLFPRKEEQTAIPMMIEFPYEVYARSHNSYYKKMLMMIKILSLLVLFILLSWLFIVLFTNYTQELISKVSTNEFSETHHNIKNSMESLVTKASVRSNTGETTEKKLAKENYSDYYDKNSSNLDIENQTERIVQISSTDTEMDANSFTESSSLQKNTLNNEPVLRNNKLAERLDEIWKKLPNELSSVLQNLTSESNENLVDYNPEDKVKTENATLSQSMNPYESTDKTTDSTVVNTSLKNKSEESDEDESLEFNFSEYYDGDKNELNADNQTETTVQKSNTETEMNDISVTESNKVKENILINQPDFDYNILRIDELWKKVLKEWHIEDDDNTNEVSTVLQDLTTESNEKPVGYNPESKVKAVNATLTQSTESYESSDKTIDSSVVNASSENKSEESDEDKSSVFNFSEYYDEDSNEDESSQEYYSESYDEESSSSN